MPHPISENVWSRLTCSYCNHQLEKTNDGAMCVGCGLEYSYTEAGSIDLRLKKPRTYNLALELADPSLPRDDSKFRQLEINPAPEADLSGLRVPRHLTREMLSYFPKAKSQNSLMLDLGCGGGIHKEVCEAAGFEWVGLDYESAHAPILGDAHALPFMDESFEFILCITVLQYVRYPFVMMREAYRVLKPGGKFIGTVAFLEPSHGTSFYHHSHLGTYNSLQAGGFTVEQVAPSEQWPALMALASMGLFHGLPRGISQSIVYPLQLLHKLWWQIASLATGRNLNELRVRHFTGSFTFIAAKTDKSVA